MDEEELDLLLPLLSRPSDWIVEEFHLKKKGIDVHYDITKRILNKFHIFMEYREFKKMGFFKSNLVKVV